MPEVSVVMTAHKRTMQLRPTLESLKAQTFKDFETIVVEDGNSDEGRTEALCAEFTSGGFPVRYFQRQNRSTAYFSNPAVPNNIGLRRAEGNIIVLQNAENRHMSNDNIAKLAAAIRENPMTTVFGAVEALKKDGTFDRWYTHSIHARVPLFFCQATLAAHIMKMRGFDEDYKYYGYDDNDFSDRLEAMGLTHVYRDDIYVQHQWHESTGCSYGANLNAEVYVAKTRALKEDPTTFVRNLGRDWGVHES